MMDYFHLLCFLVVFCNIAICILVQDINLIINQKVFAAEMANFIYENR